MIMYYTGIFVKCLVQFLCDFERRIKMKKTGVKVTQEDFNKLEELVKKGRYLKQGISIISEKKGKSNI